jgi:hypothetical protein
MLVASRDPFHGTHQVPPPNSGGRIARTMSLLQVVGTVLAIPVGLGSAYTMYKSNFTAEASCQALRANIIQILDKSVDASARHMLVRRDVVAFEQACGGFDPDAAAAFKTLLSTDKSVAAVAPAPRRVEAQPKPFEVKAVEAKSVERKIETKAEAKVETKPVIKADAKSDAKVEPRQDAIAKMMAAKPVAPVAAVAAPPQRDAAASDAEWLEAVRGALVSRDAGPSGEAIEAKVEPKQEDVKSSESKTFESKPAEAKAAIAAPLVRQAVREAPPMSIENVRTPPLATVSAPVLPPPSAIGSVPSPREEAPAEPRLETVRADVNSHPVPPGAIPEPAPGDSTPTEERSRIGQLISHIPFANRLLDK